MGQKEGPVANLLLLIEVDLEALPQALGGPGVGQHAEALLGAVVHHQQPRPPVAALPAVVRVPHLLPPPRMLTIPLMCPSIPFTSAR